MIMIFVFWVCIAVIAYTYVGYPVLITLLAALKPKKSYSSQEMPFVTLLIAAFNEQMVIGPKLENSLALDYPKEKLQILVANDGSTDKTAEVVKGYADQGVDLFSLEHRQGKTTAISNALREAKGEIVIFSDSNNMYYPNLIRAITSPFTDPKVGAVSGTKLVADDEVALGQSEGLYWKYESFIKKAESRFGNCTAITGEVWASRRNLISLPPKDFINEDFYMGMQVIRQGYRVAYTPQARSYKIISKSAKDEIERRSRISAGRYQILARAFETLPFNNPVVIWQVLSHKILRLFLPFAMLGALLANVWMVIRLQFMEVSRDGESLPLYGALLILQFAFYGIGLFNKTRARSDTKIGKLMYLPTFLIDSNYAAVNGLIRFLSKRHTNLWQRAPRAVPPPPPQSD